MIKYQPEEEDHPAPVSSREADSDQSNSRNSQAQETQDSQKKFIPTLTTREYSQIRRRKFNAPVPATIQREVSTKTVQTYREERRNLHQGEPSEEDEHRRNKAPQNTMGQVFIRNFSDKRRD